jgi:methylmalonyl-CoA/ethylmalonyl-CoA epimerase
MPATNLALGTIHQVSIPSSDIERSIEFYRDRLGARLIAKFDPPGLVFFDFDGVRLLLSGMSSESGSGSTAVYFRVDDVDEAYQSLVAAGIKFKGEPQMIYRDEDGTFGPAGSEEWMAFFEDPDGNTLALASCKTQ